MMQAPQTDKLWPWVRWFLENHLPQHRGVSVHTVQSYRTAFRQFFAFMRRRRGDTAKQMQLRDVDPVLVLDFLGWLEKRRGRSVGAATRNCRLAALRSFFRFLELHRGSTDGVHWERMRQLPFKRCPHPAVDHLEPRELEFVFAEISTRTAAGFRDLALLGLLYNTGARVAEIAAARCSGLTLGELPSIRLIGKGNRERVCPLWRSLAQLLGRYIDEYRRPPRTGCEGFIFINQRHANFTRYGVARVVEKYLRRAACHTPSLRAKRLSAHSLRHTTAVHLLENGADVNVIKAWLGHASTQATSRYLDLTIEKYRGLLERFQPPALLLDRVRESTSSRHEDDISSWLDRL